MDAIFLHNVKTHNLKNFDLILNHKKLYVVTGISGSGKSSLAFDTLYAEGQRRYLESLSAYARQFLERMEKPDVESVSGIPPAIALEAKNGVTNARSTVGTQTEINDYLRLLFARIGRIECPDCGREVLPSQPEGVADRLLTSASGEEAAVLFSVGLEKGGKRYLDEFLSELERQGFLDFFFKGKIVGRPQLLKAKSLEDEVFVCADRVVLVEKNRKRLIDSLELAYRYGRGESQVACAGKLFRFSEGLRCFSCGRAFREPTPNTFSFNSPLGACPECQGFGRVITIDDALVVPDEGQTVEGGAIEPWTKPSASWEFGQLLEFCKRKKIPVDKPWRELSETQRRLILEGSKGEDYFSVRDFFNYLEKKIYKMHVRVFLSKYRRFVPCPVCRETRLKPEALWVRVRGKNIHELLCLSIDELFGFFETFNLTASEQKRVGPIFLEIKKRMRFLKEVGLGYLTLARLSRTLSGGEFQRINLATSLGSALVDTLYVLDEPSIGLHERDNELLMRLIKELRDLGNTVVVVEHDRFMIESADEVIDLGPLGGDRGGEIIFQGTVSDLKRSERSLTGQYLAGVRKVQSRVQRQDEIKERICIRGASEHNLKHIDVDIPLGRFVVMTGVSGSGKSTLLYDTLYRHYLRYRGRPVQDLGKIDSISGFEAVDDVVLVDQSPMGRSPRSNPVTYIKAFDEIRKIFASLPEARYQGFGPGHFSFNVDGGRCPTCKGDGRLKVEMHFLADVYVPCEHCQGKRFKPEILRVRYLDKNLDDVLSMTVDEAIDFFRDHTTLTDKLSILTRVGLGYLRLGQSALTLSGGEAQRLKLAFELTQKPACRILYLFDEPTTGLHYHDIHYLIRVFEELLSRGHSLVVIEHNMEIIRCADIVIDLGPEGGQNGGEVLYAGPLQGLMECDNSLTGKYLKRYLERMMGTPAGKPG
ncbi:MAG: excinuclease ABC subunit UvrA [Candidatus Omnitrophica bacterium]|nr:excinuclease ABC subunit UvrA [Candidatus Omnitrophota bacterium]